MRFHQLSAFAMAAFLTLSSVPARPTVLGVVVEAERAHVNTTPVTEGATVYAGDRFSTEVGGMLFLQERAAMLELTAESVVTVRSRATGTTGTEAELGQGTLVFKVERSNAMEAVAREARIWPASEKQTIGQVSIFGPDELRVFARRGSLQFLYRGETETIAEGEAYRVLLNLSDEDASKKEAVKAARTRKMFLMFAITGAVAGAAAAAALHENHGRKKMESPDRP